jgi:predicted Abi (CAAX) family protease
MDKFSYSKVQNGMRIIGDRLLLAICTRPQPSDWLYAALLLLLYAVVYLPMGFANGFLSIEPRSDGATILGVAIGAFLSPGLTEECVFRVLLIPHRVEPARPIDRWLWVCVSWLAFVAYHPFNPLRQSFFEYPIFLIGAGLLGMICTSSYLRSGSLWIPVIMHWLIVVIWLLGLGGLGKFDSY